MTRIPLPGIRPADARFSSGPTKKRPGGDLKALEGALLGRSHRSKPGKAKLKEAIDRTPAIWRVPADFRMEGVPASDSGAVERGLSAALGAGGGHGMLIISPRAVVRLESSPPPRPLPKIFRMTKKGKLDQELFEGATINTPSLLATEDYLDALKWADGIGGLDALHARANANTQVLTEWVARTPWVDFLVADAANRSNTSVCLKVVDQRVTALPEAAQAEFAKNLAATLEREGVALDAASYRSAPPGLRIWCGATIERSDVQSLTPCPHCPSPTSLPLL